mmetsp:Transcript_20775/g.45728  ORF Transcript_20775/g.45728 Transcript_20775/m.45728 type:complete len:212 (-) Transcript_20775:2601-3236(-)
MGEHTVLGLVAHMLAGLGLQEIALADLAPAVVPHLDATFPLAELRAGWLAPVRPFSEDAIHWLALVAAGLRRAEGHIGLLSSTDHGVIPLDDVVRGVRGAEPSREVRRLLLYQIPLSHLCGWAALGAAMAERRPLAPAAEHFRAAVDVRAGSHLFGVLGFALMAAVVRQLPDLTVPVLLATALLRTATPGFPVAPDAVHAGDVRALLRVAS